MKLELLHCPLPYLSLHTVEPSLEDFLILPLLLALQSAGLYLVADFPAAA